VVHIDIVLRELSGLMLVLGPNIGFAFNLYLEESL
jgi:hypothetical protein